MHRFLASFPGSPEREINTRGSRAWYIFSRDHDIIKIGPEFLEQKGNVLRVIQPALRSTLGMYDIGPPMSLRVCPRAIKVFLPPFYY